MTMSFADKQNNKSRCLPTPPNPLSTHQLPPKKEKTEKEKEKRKERNKKEKEKCERKKEDPLVLGGSLDGFQNFPLTFMQVPRIPESA